MENEVSTWQFIDKYYEVLLEMYKTIRLSFHQEDYETAFKDMEQIYFHISREAELNTKTKAAIGEAKEMIQAIYMIKDEYNTLLLNDRIPSISKQREIFMMKKKFRENISLLYLKLTGIISDLKMFMPKAEGYTKSGADRFKDKFIKPEFRGEL